MTETNDKQIACGYYCPTYIAEQPTYADWEQRRYEIAKDVYAQLTLMDLSKDALREVIPATFLAHFFCNFTKFEILSYNAVQRADALIEELKKQ